MEIGNCFGSVQGERRLKASAAESATLFLDFQQNLTAFFCAEGIAENGNMNAQNARVREI